ncbi:hypothetical protein [Neochlamydia sp. AcF84]|uniref:pilus assembly FimT family protein n=1 Tax=Neochlamydia sp. AcF84 TaxID=2315858 RepID=UPI00140BD5A3|nr:hypothetical protein [Neochlamydia sp. AcF84]
MRPYSKSKRVQKRFITLLELLMVMAILALTLGVIGFNVHKALREQRFKTETDLVVDYLRLAQNLMLIMNADVHVIFESAQNSQANLMRLKVEGNLDDKLLELVTNKEKPLHYIQLIEFHDENRTQHESNKIDVKFFSKGSVMSKGAMRLATHAQSNASGTLERFIYLPGYPQPIVSTLANSPDFASKEKQNADFEIKLINATMQEIQEKRLAKSNNL